MKTEKWQLSHLNNIFSAFLQNKLYFKGSFILNLKGKSMSKLNIYKAMGSLAYAMAMADGKIQEEEKVSIKKMALEEFELSDIDNAWITTMFKEMEENSITLEDAYQFSIDTLEANRFAFDFDEAMKNKCLKFIERTAEAFGGVEYAERAILKRLKNDLSKF